VSGDGRKKEELNRLWGDDRNWGHGIWGCYFCKEDPRLLVPKRRLPGGTFNMAHRMAVPLMTAIIVFLILLVIILPLWGLLSRIV
jgi:uncharacterized membrane protein